MTSGRTPDPAGCYSPEYPDTVRHPPGGITVVHDPREMQTGHPKIVKDFWDIPPFHASFLQRLSDRHRWVLYRLSFSQSPQQQFDEAYSKAWTKDATARLDKAVYGLLQEALQDFGPDRPIFLRHRIDHPLCSSRVWFSLCDKFKGQLDISGELTITAARKHQIRELTKTNNKGFQTPTSTPTIRQTSTGTAPHAHTYNTHTRLKVPHIRHIAHKKARSHHDIPHGASKALYTRHTTQKKARSRISDIKHTTHKEPHNSRPHHHAHKTAKDRPHEGINRSQPQFKKLVKRLPNRPSDRVDNTHTHTHPMPKRLLPSLGMKSKGTRIEKSDGILNPIHPRDSPHPLSRGCEKITKGHTKNNTKRVPRKRSTLGRPCKRAKPVQNKPDLPGPTAIDPRRHNKERLAPVHFLKSSRNPAHIKRRLSWWDLAITTHVSKSRLSRRWTYILNRRQHRQPAEPQQPWHRHTAQIRTKRGEYLGTRMDCSWEGIHGYTTPLPTLPPDIIQGQLNNIRFTMISQPDSTVTHLKTTLGRHFKMNVNSFYVTTNGSSIMLVLNQISNSDLKPNFGYKSRFRMSAS